MDKNVDATMIVIQRRVQTGYVQVIWVRVIALQGFIIGLRVYFEAHSLK